MDGGQLMLPHYQDGLAIFSGFHLES